MIGVSFWRILRAAGQNFFRNVWLSLATTVIMTITLLIVLFLYFANVFGGEVLSSIEDKVDLSVTFGDEVSEEDIRNVIDTVRGRADVKAVQFVSSEEALRIFKERNVDRPFIEESLDELGDNPLPASMFVVATEPRFYEVIAGHLQGEQYSSVIAEVHFEDSRAVIDRLIAVITTIKNTGIVVTAVFVVLVVLIMFNTVRLAIYSFREEIDIMHLVGASRWFIRGPFVVESVLVALLAVFASSVIAYPTVRAVSPELERFFFTGYAQTEPFSLYAYALDNWLTVLGLQVLLAVGLAIFSSLIAIQRYLKT